MSTGGAATIAMRGAGYYSANTIGAKTVIDKVGDLIVEAADKMPGASRKVRPSRSPILAPPTAARRWT